MAGIEKELNEGYTCGLERIERVGGEIKGIECLWRVNAVAKIMFMVNAVRICMRRGCVLQEFGRGRMAGDARNSKNDPVPSNQRATP